MNIIALVPIGSWESILSVVGIPLFLICLLICIGGRIAGWLVVLNIFCAGMLFVGLWRVNPVPSKSTLEEENSGMAPYIFYEGTYQNERRLLLDADYGRNHYNPDHYVGADRFYRMHCISGIPYWLWNPDALFFSPALALVISALLSPLIMIITAANRAKYAARRAVNEIINY